MSISNKFLRAFKVTYFIFCRITLSIRYDNLFLQNVAGGDHAKAKTKVHSVVNLARPYFKWASLGNEVSLKILDIAYVKQNLQLAGNPGGTL